MVRKQLSQADYGVGVAGIGGLSSPSASTIRAISLIAEALRLRVEAGSAVRQPSRVAA